MLKANELRCLGEREDKGRKFVRINYMDITVVICNDIYFRLLDFEKPGGLYVDEYINALYIAKQDLSAKYLDKIPVEIKNVQVVVFDYNGTYIHIDYVRFISRKLNSDWFQFESKMNKLIELYSEKYKDGKYIDKSLVDSEKQAEKQAEQKAELPYSAIVYEAAIQQLSKSVMDEHRRNDELIEELRKANMKITVLAYELNESKLKINRVKDALA
jgi:hypothetical protein